MNRRPEFAVVEARLAAYVRDPTAAPPPEDVDPARAAVYARLVRRNLDALLKRGFPVLHRVCAGPQWERFVTDFVANHRARTPLFGQVAREFANFLAAFADPGIPGWCAELADYECLEIECAQDPRGMDAAGRIDPAADLLDDAVVLNPLARVRDFRYPVHTIAPGRLPAAAEPVQLVVYRAPDDRVRFLQLNAVTARLVRLLAGDGARHSGRALLRRIAEEIAHPRPERMLAAGREVLEDLRGRGLILGARYRS